MRNLKNDKQAVAVFSQAGGNADIAVATNLFLNRIKDAEQSVGP